MAMFFLLKDAAGNVTHEFEQMDPVGMTPDEIAEATRKANGAASYEIVPHEQVNRRLLELVNDNTIDLKTATHISTLYYARHEAEHPNTVISEGGPAPTP